MVDRRGFIKMLAALPFVRLEPLIDFCKPRIRVTRSIYGKPIPVVMGRTFPTGGVVTFNEVRVPAHTCEAAEMFPEHVRRQWQALMPIKPEKPLGPPRTFRYPCLGSFPWKEKADV